MLCRLPFDAPDFVGSAQGEQILLVKRGKCRFVLSKFRESGTHRRMIICVIEITPIRRADEFISDSSAGFFAFITDNPCLLT